MIVDTTDGKHYTPTLILHDTNNPEKPPIAINFYYFLNSKRFKFVNQQDDKLIDNLFL